MTTQHFRAAIHIAAVFALYLAVAMLAPAATDLYFGSDEWRIFVFSAFLVGGGALAVALATRGGKPPVSPRFGFLVVNLLWLTIAAAGMIPFLLSSVSFSFTDAAFESMSGVTATGSSIMTNVDAAPRGILLWRSLLSFMGGLGVIALGLFLLPYLKIGGVSYFKIESNDFQDRPFERLQTFMASLFGIYAFLGSACAIAYMMAGMEGFHAINHAMTTVATGGFSTHSDSFMRYDDNLAILWIATVFMFIGGLPFSIMMLLIVKGQTEALRDPQIRVYAGYAFMFTAATAVYMRLATGAPIEEAATRSAFNLISIITTTGFASEDYNLWGPFAVAMVFLATFMGGCSGSTTGGMKAYRFLLLYQLVVSGLHRLIYPSSVVPVRYGERSVDDRMQAAVVLFMSAFFVLFGIFTVLLGATGLDFTTALTGSLSSLTNVGPGLGAVIGPIGTYAPLPDIAKWICMAAMMLGRLEILVVLVVFSPAFWRR